MGEEPAPDPGPGARRRRGSAYIINGGDATVAKEWGIVHLTLGGSGDGVVSHHSSRDLSCTRSSQRRREGGIQQERRLPPPPWILPHRCRPIWRRRWRKENMSDWWRIYHLVALYAKLILEVAAHLPDQT
jgi:hypothetical protein